MAGESIPKFMCHYYNHYFAHTAGGRMIGRRMADNLLESTTLKFYQWEGGDVKVKQPIFSFFLNVIFNFLAEEFLFLEVFFFHFSYNFSYFFAESLKFLFFLNFSISLFCYFQGIAR